MPIAELTQHSVSPEVAIERGHDDLIEYKMVKMPERYTCKNQHGE
jgi:hypothetical protein